jgi:hypothetical protein
MSRYGTYLDQEFAHPHRDPVSSLHRGENPHTNLKLVVNPISGCGGPLFQWESLRISKLLVLGLSLVIDSTEDFQFTGLTASQYRFF